VYLNDSVTGTGSLRPPTKRMSPSIAQNVTCVTWSLLAAALRCTGIIASESLLKLVTTRLADELQVLPESFFFGSCDSERDEVPLHFALRHLGYAVSSRRSTTNSHLLWEKPGTMRAIR